MAVLKKYFERRICTRHLNPGQLQIHETFKNFAQNVLYRSNFKHCSCKKNTFPSCQNEKKTLSECLLEPLLERVVNYQEANGFIFAFQTIKIFRIIVVATNYFHLFLFHTTENQ